MPAFPYGSVYLNAIQFDTDPSRYEPLHWPKRQTYHKTIGGGAKLLDFGRYMKDMTITLASTGGKGEHQFMREQLVIQIQGLMMARGVSYQLIDWLSNEFQVAIMDFDAVPKLRGTDQYAATIQTYDYTLSLQVLSITTLFGIPYIGA